MPAVSNAARVQSADLLDSDSLPLDRGGDQVARRTTIGDLKAAAGLSAADQSKLDGIEAAATADQTGAEIVALLTALQGADRLGAGAIKDLTEAAAGDLTGAALAGSTLTFTRRSGADIVINLPAGGGGDSAPAALTGPQIVALLEALAGGDRLAASAIDGFDAAVESATDGDLTGISIAGRVLTITRRGSDNADITIQLPAAGQAQAQTGPEIVALLTALAGNARLSYDALKDTPDAADDDDPADTWAIQFSVLTQVDGATSRALTAGTQTPGEVIVDFTAAAALDEAELGITRATGRTAFNNLHSDADTQLRTTGKLRCYLTNTPAGQLKAIVREYDAGNNLLRATTIADHGVAASAGKRTFDLPLGDTVMQARRGRTYDTILRFEPAANLGAGAAFGLDTGADESNLQAWRRHHSDPASGNAGVTEAELQAEVGTLEAADTALGVRIDGEQAARIAADNALSSRVDTLESDDGGGSGAALRGLPANVAAPLRGKDLYIRPTAAADGDGTPTHSYAATADIPGVTKFVDDLATLPTRQHERVRLGALWRAHPPGDYEGVLNAVQRNRAVGTFGSRDADYQGTNYKQYGWDLQAPGVMGSVQLGGDFCPEFYWWRPGVSGTPTVLNAWIHPDYNAASIYVEATSSETSTTVGQGMNRTSGRLRRDGVDYIGFQSSAPLSADEVSALANIADASGANDVAVDFFASPDGSAKGAPINFQPEFIWQAVLGQHHLHPFISHPDDADRRILRGADILADDNVEPVYPSAAAATAAKVLERPGLVYAVLTDRATRPQRFFVRRGYPGAGGDAGAVSGRNRIRIRLNPFSNGLGYYWAHPYRAGHIELFDNVQHLDRIDPGHSIGVVTIAGTDAQGNNPLVQIGVRDIAESASTGAPAVDWPDNQWAVTVGNTTDAAGRPARQFDLVLTRNTGADATGVFGGVTWNFYSFRFTDQLAADLGDHGQWHFADDTVVLDFAQTVGGTPINFNPNEVEFTRGAGFRSATDDIPAASIPIPGSRQIISHDINIAAFHPSGSQAAAADHVAWTRIVSTEAGDDAEITAKFTIASTGAAAANRMEADFRLEVDPAFGQPVILDRASHYIRHSTNTEFTQASFSLSGYADLGIGDTIRLVSRSFDQNPADADVMLSTADAARSVNKLQIIRR